MVIKIPQTALLLFTRTVGEEVRYKKLVPAGSLRMQYQVANTFVQQSREVLAATGLPFFVFSSGQQTGHSFAERFYNAFATVFAQGYDQVIAIGNDCPELKPQDILAAVNLLENQEVVLGPDKAGGIYLLGLTRRVFKTCSSFATIRWNTAAVLSDAISFFLSQAKPFVLPTKYRDINSARALKIAFKQKLFHSAIYKILQRLFWVIIPSRPRLKSFNFSEALLRLQLFRGPPASSRLF